jgi:hypothetical protein
MLTSCYQRNTDVPCTLTCETECPAPLVCRGGSCVEVGGSDCLLGDGGADSASDAPIDAPITSCTPPTTAGSEAAFTTGQWFVPRLAVPRYGVLFRDEPTGGGGQSIGRIHGTLSDELDSNVVFQQILEDQSGTLYREPRLSPSGLEMFLRIEISGPMMQVQIGVSTRTAGTHAWTNPAAVPILGLTNNLDTLVDPSPPTTTMPRRMVLSRTGIGFVELEEVAIGQWTVHREEAAPSFANDESPARDVVFLGEAHLTQDGLRLVFRGQITGQDIGAYYVERATVDDAFPAPAHELPTQSSVHNPFFTSDCQNLFYTRDDGQVYRVRY